MTAKIKPQRFIKKLDLEKSSSIEMKLKKDLHVILKRTIDTAKISNRELEKIWNVPQPRVSEVVTGKLDKVSVSRLLNYLSVLGVSVRPTSAIRK